MGSDPAQEVTTSPYPEEVGSEPAQEVDATTNITKREEEKKEDRDTHSTRNCKLPPLVASPQNKRKQTVKPSSRHRRTLQIREVETPTVRASPLTAPVVTPLALPVAAPVPPPAASVPPPVAPVVAPAAGTSLVQFVSVTSEISFFYFSWLFL